MKKLRKGNALLFTVIILFAISTIATALTMYFYRTNLLAKNTNTYYEKRLELSNEMNNTYKMILNNDDNNDAGTNLQRTITSIANLDNGYYSFSTSKYRHTFTHMEMENGIKKCKYSIENTVKSKVYTLERVLLLTSENTYSFESGEVYYVHVVN